MGRANYSIETQFDVVVRAGLLPIRFFNKTPFQFTASDVEEIERIFEEIPKDLLFKNYLRKAVDAIDDREDLARSREESDPRQLDLFDNYGGSDE